MELLSAATTVRSLVVLAFIVAQTAVAAEHVIPLFTSSSNASQGFARIINHSDRRGTVSIRATDDSGHLTNLSGSTSLSAIPAVSMTRDHNIILRVVRVTPEWVSYASANGGWVAAVIRKESDHLKYFEAAIWEETASIHLYEFDNNFDPSPPQRHTWSDDEKIEHRERYRVLEFSDMPPAYTDERSTFLRSAFERIATYIVGRFPNSNHHLMFSGHGGPGGRLFESLMSRGDAAEFLSHWHEALGRPLGVIDMGGPCNKGGFGDLETFCPYSSYYIASDLPNGGYTMDEWTIEKYREVDPETRYHDIFQHSGSLRSAFRARIDLRRQGYEYSRENMIANKTEQANYLYSCRDFVVFASALRGWPVWHNRSYANTSDVRTYLELNEAPDQLVAKFDKVIDYRADNRDFFDWEVDANGMLMPHNLDGGGPYIPPAVNDVRFASVPANGDAYERDEEIRVQVGFNRGIAVTGTPRLALTIGAYTRQAAFSTASDSSVFFTYTVRATDIDADGVSIAAGALTLNDGAIRDVDDNDADLDLGPHAIVNDARHKVAGTLPPAKSRDVAVGDELTLDLPRLFAVADADATYTATSSSDAVTVRIENGTLIVTPNDDAEDGIVTVTVTVVHADGTRQTLRFPVTVEAAGRGFWRGWRLTLVEGAAPSGGSPAVTDNGDEAFAPAD